MELIEVKVQIPADKIADFHRVFADWFEAATRVLATQPAEREEAALKWWKSLTVRERQVFELWLDHAGELVPADRIVESLGLAGPREIAGILAWPNRKAKKVGFAGLTWTFRLDQETGAALYGIEDVELAVLLRKVRARA